jgi:hypothetical protein
MFHVTLSSNRLFHMKHYDRTMNEVILLSDTEFTEDDV